MPPAPLVVSSLLGATAAAGVIGLAIDQQPFSAPAAVFVAVGGVVLSLIAIAGVLLARGRWSRWVAVALAAGWFTAADTTGTLSAAAVATMLLATATAVGAAGRWLPRWLRHRPSADGPPVSAVTLLLILAATPLAVGLFDPRGDAGVAGWALVLWSSLLALGVARAMPTALWAGRLAHPVIAFGCALAMGAPALVGVIIKAAVETGLMWRRDIHLAVIPLVPQRATTVPTPPELVDPAVLKAAGLDDRGRRLEDS